MKILVADDSPLSRRLVHDTLAKQGYTVVLAKTGREARDAFVQQRPSIVITDWEMPDISGVELCKEIRQNDNLYTYIVLLTGNSDKKQIIEGLAAGADDYLTKPFDSGELLARVGVGRRISELHRQIQMKNLLLEELSLTDSLTELPNRRAIRGWADREINGAVRHGFSFWVVIADLDHFKQINDTYGHETGDAVLRQFAKMLKANTRSSNMCGRLGGEEFVIAMSHVDRTGVQIAIERLRSQFEHDQFAYGGFVLQNTASFGIAGFETGGVPDLDNLLRQADGALYQAKHRGRNRLEFAI